MFGLVLNKVYVPGWTRTVTAGWRSWPVQQLTGTLYSQHVGFYCRGIRFRRRDPIFSALYSIQLVAALMDPGHWTVHSHLLNVSFRRSEKRVAGPGSGGGISIISLPPGFLQYLNLLHLVSAPNTVFVYWACTFLREESRGIGFRRRDISFSDLQTPGGDGDTFVFQYRL